MQYKARPNVFMLYTWKSQLFHCSLCVQLILISILLLAIISSMFLSFIFLFMYVSYFYVHGQNFNLTFRWRSSMPPNTELTWNLRNSKFRYWLSMSLPLVSSLSKMDLINIVPSYLLTILSLTSVVLRRTSSERYFSFVFSNLTLHALIFVLSIQLCCF